MSDQYGAPQTDPQPYAEQTDVFVTPMPSSLTMQVNMGPVTQEIQIAGQKVLVPRVDTILKLQAQMQQLQQELQTLKSRHAKLQQQHVTLAQQVVQLQRTQGASASYD